MQKKKKQQEYETAVALPLAWGDISFFFGVVLFRRFRSERYTTKKQITGLPSCLC